jgi:hypothetical protein
MGNGYLRQRFGEAPCKHADELGMHGLHVGTINDMVRMLAHPLREREFTTGGSSHCQVQAFREKQAFQVVRRKYQ